MLYEAAKTLTKYIQPNVEYEFNDLKIEILKTPEFENIQIPTNDQREAGRRYSYWVKSVQMQMLLYTIVSQMDT